MRNGAEIERSDAHAGEVAEAEAAALVVQYQAGEEAALARLHERLTPAIRAFLRRYRTADLPPTVTLQDVSQQSWVVLAELAARWHPSGSFLAYFFRSFPREIDRFVRRAYPTRRTRSVQMLTIPHDDLVTRMDRLADGQPCPEEALPLMEDLVALPTAQRTAFLLHVLDGHDFDAIGRMLQVSRASAHRLYQHALAQLREAQAHVPSSELRASSVIGSLGTRNAETETARLVHTLHTVAGPQGDLPGRRRMAELTGLNRREYTALIARLEAAGALVDRAPTRAGRLIDPTPQATLQRLEGPHPPSPPLPMLGEGGGPVR